jgi:hypothetical protein
MYETLFNLVEINNLTQHYNIAYPWQLTGNRLTDISFLQKFNTQKKILITADTDPYSPGLYEYWLSLSNEFPNKVKILTSDLNAFFQDGQLIYFPTWMLNQLLQKNYQTTDKTFRFSFLSSQARFHRLYFFQQVRQYLTDSDCFAVYATNYTNQASFVNSDSIKYLGHTANLTNDIPYFSSTANDRIDEYFDTVTVQQRLPFTNEHNAFASMINIAGESNINDNFVFLSEKTWKPIQSRCLFFMLGNLDSDKLLTKLGFSLFDTSNQSLTLLDKISYISTLMKDWDLGICEQLYKNNIDLVEHNYARLYSKELKNLFKTYLQERLDL